MLGSGGFFGANRAVNAVDEAADGAVRGLTQTRTSASLSSSSDRFTYRGDTRPPNEIFQIGLQPWNPNGTLTLHEHVYGFNEITGESASIYDSQWVSTSYHASSAKSFANKNFEGGYVYVVRPRNGVDVNTALGGNSPEDEFVVLGGIQVEDILGAKQVNLDDRFTGSFISNPRFLK